MTRSRALIVVTTVLACSCGAAAPVVTDASRPPAASGAAAGRARAHDEPLAARFERYVCAGAPACDARDISDPALDYGAWLAASLGVAPLARLRVLDAFYIEAGPGEGGSSLSLGAVSFLSADADQTRAIVAQLAKIPDAFKDGKVIMRFKPLVDGDRIDLVFTDSFDPRMDRFLGSI